MAPAGRFVRLAIWSLLVTVILAVGCSFNLSGDGSPIFGRTAANYEGGREELFAVDPIQVIYEETPKVAGTPSVTTFSVRLLQRPTSNVTIPARIEPLNRLEIDPLSVVFSPTDWDKPQTFRISGGAPNQTIDPGIFNAILGAASSTDPLYNNADPHDVRIVFHDTTQPIQLSPYTKQQVDETGAETKFYVSLGAAPTDTVTVKCTVDLVNEIGLAIPDGTALDAGANDAGADGGTGTGTFTSAVSVVFPSGTVKGVSREIHVRGLNDDIADKTQHAHVQCRGESTDNRFNEVEPPALEIDNLDDDQAIIFVSAVTVGDIGESLATGKPVSTTFEVFLGSQPASDVVLPLATSNPTLGATVDPPSLTFTATNYKTHQVVTITAVNDSVADGTQDYTIGIGPPQTADQGYAQLTDPRNVQGKVFDDEQVAVVIAPTTFSTTEAAGAGNTATLDVTLASQPINDVVVDVGSNNGSEGTVNVNQLTFTNANWNVPQPVVVTGMNDNVDDGDKGYVVSATINGPLTTDAVYKGAPGASANGTNIDDDTAAVVTSPSQITLNEGANGTFQVHLLSQPTANVTVVLDSGGWLSPSSVSLTFSAANWNVNQPANFTNPNDCLAGNAFGSPTIPISVGIQAGFDLGYNAAAFIPGRTPDVSILSVDNEPAPQIRVTPTSGSTDKSAGTTFQFTVSLTTQPRTSVTLPITSGDTMKGTVSPSSVVLGQTCTPSVVVTVTPGNTTGASYTVSVGADNNAATDPDYQGVNPPDVTVTPNN
jgi:hypothetical protein